MIIRTIIRILAAVLLLGGAAALAWTLRDFYLFLHKPLTESVDVTIEPGWGPVRVSQALAKHGVIGNPLWFRLLNRYHGQGFLLSGHYRFEVGETPILVLQRLRSGAVVRNLRILIQEGLTLLEIGQVLAQAGWPKAPKILQDPGLPRRLGWFRDHLEGGLFPDTYFFDVGDPLEKLLTRMVQRTILVLEEEWAGRDPGFPLDPYQTLVLASVVEEETGIAGERSHVSGVFLNRLRLGMKLQSDPTVIYGLLPGFDGNLTRVHLRTPGPYNSYTQKGLPPTPICSPGRAAIHGVVHPDSTGDLYFVARGDGTGTHVFAETLGTHQANVRQFQLRGPRGNDRGQ
ncbi:MAG: endolytic transglycosylase MltG [Magnetococcales bacterium]|nr:endolytic transglycosylase MltG [Magnetococcales bacterium]